MGPYHRSRPEEEQHAERARGHDRAADRGGVRAVLLDGTKGYALDVGTWHSLDRFPLYPPDTDWVIITDHETQQDLTAAYAGQGGGQLTHEVDYAELGVTFALRL